MQFFPSCLILKLISLCLAEIARNVRGDDRLFVREGHPGHALLARQHNHTTFPTEHRSLSKSRISKGQCDYSCLLWLLSNNFSSSQERYVLKVSRMEFCRIFIELCIYIRIDSWVYLFSIGNSMIPRLFTPGKLNKIGLLKKFAGAEFIGESPLYPVLYIPSSVMNLPRSLTSIIR
jgi:hypothetical protein